MTAWSAAFHPSPSLISVSAPYSSNNFTTAVCPSDDALINAVLEQIKTFESAFRALFFEAPIVQGVVFVLLASSEWIVRPAGVIVGVV